MKRILWMLGLVWLTTLSAMAQKDKRAQEILDAMSKQYQALKSYQATFTYSMAGATTKGDLTVKSEKFHLILADRKYLPMVKRCLPISKNPTS